MKTHGSICRIGLFYDGSFFAHAQQYFYHDRKVGWLSFQAFHCFIEQFVGTKEQGFASYKVVYAAWHQGLFTSKDATEDHLRFDRNRYHDLLHAGVEPKYLPMSQAHGEKGTDVALAVNALQVALDSQIDIAVLVTGDADFVPLVRALNKQGIRVLAAYFSFADHTGRSVSLMIACSNPVIMPWTSPRLIGIGSSKVHSKASFGAPKIGKSTNPVLIVKQRCRRPVHPHLP